jgi:DNA polymerase sigma
MEHLGPDDYKNLHRELEEFCVAISPTIEERARRDWLIGSMGARVRHVFPGLPVEVHVIGSSATGLHLPMSDIDLCVLGVGELVRRRTGVICPL